ncbi:hypothetical protein EC988_003289 [Linderina pennispora]|nr:hypothetical protein EC988_003289 [Linderina pennispora]
MILISAHVDKQRPIKVHRVSNVVCGAEPLLGWTPLAGEGSDVLAVSEYQYQWGQPNIAPLERDQARMLTAQYAQILPEIHGQGVPMVPSSPSEFASVVAIEQTGTRGCKGEVVVREIADNEVGRVQQWAEYDLLGSQLLGDETTVLGDDMAGDMLPASFVTLRGIWDMDTKGPLVVELPPEPPASAQWMLELVSLPLLAEPEPNKSLWALYMEITRLDSLCASWAGGKRWMEDASTFRPHVWQQEIKRDLEPFADEGQIAREEGYKAADKLAEHREAFGQRVDEFIEASIKDPRGTTMFSRLGRTAPRHSASGFPERPDLDFTERLWNIAHFAYDSSDLSELLTAVAEGLETGKLQPYIQHTNQAPLAQLIKETLKLAQQKNLMDADQEHERLAQQLDLWIDEQPQDALVAVGAQKLRNDFWFYFVNGQLATPKQMSVFLDMDVEPKELVKRFWVLLRIMEVWWLVQQGVPGLPRHYVCQVVSALIEHFSAALDSEAAYEEALRVTLFLPVYATEVQEFVGAIGEGFDPTRYTIVMQEPGRSRLVILTKTAGMLGSAFNADEAVAAAGILEGGDEAIFDDYAVFEAKMF